MHALASVNASFCFDYGKLLRNTIADEKTCNISFETAIAIAIKAPFYPPGLVEVSLFSFSKARKSGSLHAAVCSSTKAEKKTAIAVFKPFIL
jgi:hypothetical protein